MVNVLTIQEKLVIRSPQQRPNRDEGPRINEQIRVEKVRLVDENGEMVGIVSVSEAIRKAEDAGLDLVEVSPNASPPVCKILDYGKYKYEQQKKASEARKKQKVVEVKELKLRPMIEEHDLGVKLKAAKKFLESGNKVKFSMRFRGREMAHKDIGMEVLQRVKEELSYISKVESEAKFEGRQVIMVLGPITAT